MHVTLTFKFLRGEGGKKLLKQNIKFYEPWLDIDVQSIVEGEYRKVTLTIYGAKYEIKNFIEDLREDGLLRND